MDDGYDHFIRQEGQFVSTLVDVCRRDKGFANRGKIPPGLYFSMRWSNMDESEKELYQLLTKSNIKKRSNEELNFHHNLKELLSDKNDNNNSNNNKPIIIPQKRLNVNHKLLETLQLLENTTSKSPVKDSIKIINTKKKKKNHYNKSYNDNKNYDNDEEKGDIDTIHEIQETDINQLLRIREDNTILNDVNEIDNDNVEMNKYSTDEADISQLLLGLKRE